MSQSSDISPGVQVVEAWSSSGSTSHGIACVERSVHGRVCSALLAVADRLHIQKTSVFVYR